MSIIHLLSIVLMRTECPQELAQPCCLGSVEMKENKSRSGVSDGDKAYGTGKVPTRKP